MLQAVLFSIFFIFLIIFSSLSSMCNRIETLPKTINYAISAEYVKFNLKDNYRGISELNAEVTRPKSIFGKKFSFNEFRIFVEDSKGRNLSSWIPIYYDSKSGIIYGDAWSELGGGYFYIGEGKETEKEFRVAFPKNTIFMLTEEEPMGIVNKILLIRLPYPLEELKLSQNKLFWKGEAEKTIMRE